MMIWGDSTVRRRYHCNGLDRHGPTTPVVDAGDLQFDVVPAKAVKGAVVSGLKNPIGSNPLEWEPDTGATLVSIANDGVVGDFRVKDL